MHEFNQSEKDGLYKAIYSRRDVRSEFLSAPVPEEILCRILDAAHHAPSVGFMQPWNFILLRDRAMRAEVQASFKKANAEAVLLFSGERREKYRKLKLEGILESSLNICVTCDRTRSGPTVLGRTTNLDMDLFSAVCAVQNLWLAARAEGIGVGWVSILHDEDLRLILKMPANVVPIAYLCLGYVTEFAKKPDLETARWLPRLSLKDLVFCDGWDRACQDDWPELYASLHAHKSGFES